MNPLDVLAWSSKHAKIPLFGSQESMVHDDGVLGAIVIVGEKHGQLAAKVVSHIFMFSNRYNDFPMLLCNYGDYLMPAYMND